MPDKYTFRVLNRAPGQERVALLQGGESWNEITGPTAIAVCNLLEGKPVFSEPQFDEREMAIIKAMFAGEVSAARLFEGGDYTYAIMNQGMSRDEMDAFLEKIG